jgi:chemotaxis protein CheD
VKPEKASPLQIKPGQVVTGTEDVLFCAVMGCSVIVTLFHPQLKLGGLCHFDRPDGKAQELTTGHANGSMLALSRKLKDLGAKRNMLEAQIIGGACQLHVKRCNAQQTVIAAQRWLKKFNLNIISTDTGGHVGRKVFFNAKSGEVMVIKTKQLRQSDWDCHA